jgi:transcriptional regulator with XRE-family HTH domain
MLQVKPLGGISPAKVRALRRKLGWSQEKLAERIGAHAQTIDKIERGQIKFSRYSTAIAEALGAHDSPQLKKIVDQLERLRVSAEELEKRRIALLMQLHRTARR